MTILKTPDLPDDELHCAVVPTEHIRLGDAVAQIGRAVELSNDDFAVLERGRSSSPARPMDFE